MPHLGALVLEGRRRSTGEVEGSEMSCLGTIWVPHGTLSGIGRVVVRGIVWISMMGCRRRDIRILLRYQGVAGIDGTLQRDMLD
jgi:hypothetical protein